MLLWQSAPTPLTALDDGYSVIAPTHGGPMPMTATLAYKGLEVMPIWFVVVVVVLAVIGIVLAFRRGR